MMIVDDNTVVIGSGNSTSISATTTLLLQKFNWCTSKTVNIILEVKMNISKSKMS